MEYIVGQNGVTEFLVLRSIGDLYHVIATCSSRDYAQLIAGALNNPTPVELRRSWND